MTSKLALAAAAVVSVLPQVAVAECTSPGCHNQIALMFGLLILTALVVVGLVIALVVLLFKKRWTAAKVVGAVLIVAVLITLGLLI